MIDHCGVLKEQHWASISFSGQVLNISVPSAFYFEHENNYENRLSVIDAGHKQSSSWVSSVSTIGEFAAWPASELIVVRPLPVLSPSLFLLTFSVRMRKSRHSPSSAAAARRRSLRRLVKDGWGWREVISGLLLLPALKSVHIAHLILLHLISPYLLFSPFGCWLFLSFFKRWFFGDQLFQYIYGTDLHQIFSRAWIWLSFPDYSRYIVIVVDNVIIKKANFLSVTPKIGFDWSSTPI